VSDQQLVIDEIKEIFKKNDPAWLVNEGIVNDLANKMIDGISGAYREGFTIGTRSNGGLNVCVKQVMGILRYLDAPISFMPVIPEQSHQDEFEKNMAENMAMIRSGLSDKNFVHVLRAMASFQHTLMSFACITGIADIYSEAFNAITVYELERIEYRDTKAICEKEGTEFTLPEVQKPDFAAILIRKQELMRQVSEAQENERRKTEEANKDKPKIVQP
jgi:hypothetical protein